MYVPLYVCECECFFNVSRSKISEAYRTKPKLVGVFSVVFFFFASHTLRCLYLRHRKCRSLVICFNVCLRCCPQTRSENTSLPNERHRIEEGKRKQWGNLPRLGGYRGIIFVRAGGPVPAGPFSGYIPRRTPRGAYRQRSLIYESGGTPEGSRAGKRCVRICILSKSPSAFLPHSSNRSCEHLRISGTGQSDPGGVVTHRKGSSRMAKRSHPSRAKRPP